MTFPRDERAELATNILIPREGQAFDDWFEQLYLLISRAVNSRDFNYFPMEITDVAQDIKNLPNYGSYIIMVSGIDSTLPTICAALNKSSDAAVGGIAVIGSQAGSAGGAWAGNVLTITSTTTNFQIAHNLANTSGNFNVRIVGTQG